MSEQSRSPLQIFVDRIARRSALPRREVEALFQLRGTTSIVQANFDIVPPGEVAKYACLVLDGLVARFGQTPKGYRRITAFHIPGDMCDLHSLVAPNAGGGLQAASRATIFRIPHKLLNEVRATFPAIAQAFWRECSIDAAMSFQRLVSAGRRSALEGMAHLLCELGARHEHAGLGSRTRYRMAATQAHLGDALGLTSVHVNRTIKTLREMKVATIKHQTVTVLDLEALVRLGDFDEAYLHLPPATDTLNSSV